MSLCNWNEVGQNWDAFTQIWNDVVPCIAEIYGQIMQGAPAEQAYQNIVGKDKKLQRKLIKVILILKGEKFEQEKEVDLRDYKVSASDIKLLMEEYYKRKGMYSVTVDEVTIR